MQTEKKNPISREEISKYFADNVLFVFKDRFHKDKNFYVCGRLISLSDSVLTILNGTSGKVNSYRFEELKNIYIGHAREPVNRKDHMQKYREYYD